MRRTIALAAAVLAVALAGCDPLDHSELRREVKSLHSIAAEGRLMAKGVERDRTKATFVRVHARELAESADETAQKVTDADVQNDLGAEARRTIELAGELSDALGELETAPGNEARARGVEAQLTDTQAGIDELEREL
jgi:hypothetical protein